MNLLSLCLKPFGRDSGNVELGSEGREGLLWFRDIGHYASGDFSMAVVQANQVLEDQSQIESGPFGTFVGVYDGHGGPEAARYVCDHLFRNFQGSCFDLIFLAVDSPRFLSFCWLFGLWYLSASRLGAFTCVVFNHGPFSEMLALFGRFGEDWLQKESCAVGNRQIISIEWDPEPRIC